MYESWQTTANEKEALPQDLLAILKRSHENYKKILKIYFLNNNLINITLAAQMTRFKKNSPEKWMTITISELECEAIALRSIHEWGGNESSLSGPTTSSDPAGRHCRLIDESQIFGSISLIKVIPIYHQWHSSVGQIS